MNSEPQIPSDEDLQLPAQLHSDLRRLSEGTIPVPSHIDSAILGDAKSGWLRRMRFRPIQRWMLVGGSIAAALLIAWGVTSMVHRTPSQMAQLGDVNRDGRIDILDALVVAQAIKSGGKLDPAWDINHDGVVDQKDVDWIAATAVNVSGTGVSQ
ncbi:MAG TPA: dockerin type I domain-containing protein [Humisphaera sp.]|jgi:hypothetical protein|nr:dockerin type I domain-containing protein [Humisphaera sp.]